MRSRIGFRAILCAVAAVALWSTGAGEAYAQETGTVQGIVLNVTTQQPVAGAQVALAGTRYGMVTNQQGRFMMLNIPAGTYTLRVELMGFRAEPRQITVTAGQATTANVSVEQTALRLGEIVVTTGVSGGAAEQAKVPFSVSRLDNTQMPVLGVNPLSQMQGRVPGANIAAVSGRPGVAPQVILRGPTSINAQGRGQEPLYIVDGVVLGASIADINPADIESVEIVKGAAASTLFGSRAAAGVISITTKRGNIDGVRFTARSEIGFNDIERDFGIARNHPFLLDETGTRFCVLDTYGSGTVCSRTIDYRAEQKRINDAPGDFALTPPAFPVDPGAVTSGAILQRAFVAGPWPGRVYNAVEQLVDPKPLALNDFSMSGRAGATTFFSSVGYTKQGGAVTGLSGFERINGRLNLGHRIGNDWSIDLTSVISRSSLDGQNQEEGGQGWFRLTRTPASVDATVRDQFGRLYIRTNLGSAGVQNENPLYTFENADREDIRWRYLVGSSVRYTPLPWLEADANFGIDRLNLNFAQFNNRGFRATNENPTTSGGLYINGVTNTQSFNTSAGLTVRPRLLDAVNSRVNLKWLYEEQQADNRTVFAKLLRVQDVPVGQNATAIDSIPTFDNLTRQMSLSAGTFLDILDRYSIDLAVRRDGSSRFGENHRWQTYGRASAAWLMAREPWFPSSVLSGFTLRASYGTAGNVPSYAAQYETYTIGSGGVLTAQTLGNPALRPEVVTELEVGTDIELWNRFSLGLTYANSLSKDQILPTEISVATGFPNQWSNAGELRNKTFEASLNLPILRGGRGFTWTARANYTSNTPTVEKLYVPQFFIGTNLQGTGTFIQVVEGERFGTIYGRRFMTSCSQLPGNFQNQCGTSTSAFQKNDEGYIVWVGEGNNPGMGITHNLWDAKLSAANAPYGQHGVVAFWGMPILIRDEATGSPLLMPLGHALPDYRIGMSHTIQYRGLSVYGLFEGAFGQSVWNQGRHWAHLDFLAADLDQSQKSVEAAKPIGYFYRAGPGPSGSTGVGGFYDILAPNSRTVEDASFIKLREISASYHVGRIGNLGDWTVSVIGRNLKTWTDYSGFDPEVGVGSSGGQSGSGLINAIDAFTFPQVRTLSFVLQTTF
jgi:TonB-linked SusC/RagA family outer membrane protein